MMTVMNLVFNILLAELFKRFIMNSLPALGVNNLYRYDYANEASSDIY